MSIVVNNMCLCFFVFLLVRLLRWERIWSGEGGKFWVLGGGGGGFCKFFCVCCGVCICSFSCGVMFYFWKVLVLYGGEVMCEGVVVRWCLCGVCVMCL